MNHRDLYIKHHGEIPDKWDVHHIDWNPDNNDIDNLIAIPKCLHVFIHKVGYKSRPEIENALFWLTENAGEFTDANTFESVIYWPQYEKWI